MINIDNNIDVYKDSIDIYCDQYIDMIKQQDKELNVYNNPSLFTGMIKYVYRYVFKPHVINGTIGDSITNINVMDANLIYNVWMLYTDLCYRFKKKPTLLNFSLLTGISKPFINDCINGIGPGANKALNLTFKTIDAECESALVDGVAEGNGIGSMFLLKAKYQYRDNSEITINTNSTRTEDPALIASRYAAAQRPELPEGLTDD